MIAPGQLIDRYELVCSIGDGGMAQVWAARERGAAPGAAGRIVALKIIHSRFAEDPAFRAMFLDEARIASSIHHRNVARVYEIGERGQLLYLAMEYVDGDSLFSLIAPDRTVPAPIALRIVADACAGLHAAHRLVDASGMSRHVVHRDVSPQNLLVSERGEVKLIDFGIAVARDRASPGTEAGTVKGKVRYMAPEQLRREPLGAYSDVFGAGAVLFRMLAGRAPYASTSEIDTMKALLENAPPPTSLPPDVPPAVAAILDRALATEISRRYATTKEMQDAIEAVLAAAPRPPDVAGWVQTNLSPAALARRARLVAIPPAAAPAPPPPAPGFMDVDALVAKAKADQAAAPAAAPPTDAATNEPAPLAAPNASAKAEPATAAAKGRPARVAVVVLVLVVAALVTLLLAPKLARDRAIAAAREVGLDLTIENVGVSFSGVTLRGVTVRAIRIPGVSATVDELYVVGLSNKGVRMTGLRAQLKGRREDLAVALALLAGDLRARQGGTPEAPRHFSVVGGRVVWDGVLGEGSRFEAGEIGLDVDSRGGTADEVRGSIGRLDLRTSDLHVGPWALSFDDGAQGGRARLVLDPPVPEGPNAMLVWSAVTPTELTVRIPRSGFANLGFDPRALGLPFDAGTEIETKLEGKLPKAGRSDIRATIDVWRARPKAFAGPIDLHFDGTAAGAPGQPLDLERATASVGPFVANLAGSVTVHDRGVRLDATFKTVPTACERLARAEAKGMGPLASILQSLGQSTGALRVTGVVHAEGSAKYDSADPEGSGITWTARETCGVSIFGL